MERMVSKVGGAPFGWSRSAAIASGLGKWPETRDFRIYEFVNGSLTFSVTALQKRVLCDCNFVL